MVDPIEVDTLPNWVSDIQFDPTDFEHVVYCTGQTTSPAHTQESFDFGESWQQAMTHFWTLRAVRLKYVVRTQPKSTSEQMTEFLFVETAIGWPSRTSNRNHRHRYS